MFYKLLSVRSQSVGRVSASPGKTLHGLLSFHLRVLSYRSSYPRAPEAARGVDDGHDRDETVRACVCRSWGAGGAGRGGGSFESKFRGQLSLGRLGLAAAQSRSVLLFPRLCLSGFS